MKAMNDLTFLDEPYQREAFISFLYSRFKFSEYQEAQTINNNHVQAFKQLGFITTKDGKKLSVFELIIGPNTKLHRNRVQLRNMVVKKIKEDIQDGSIAVYIDNENSQWRLSLITITAKFDGDGKVILEETHSTRYTYLLGRHANTRTAKERLTRLDKTATLETLEDTFAVEPLSKEFYEKISKWYQLAKEKAIFPNDKGEDDHTTMALIRLLTRLLFVWFLKEKKLINPDLFNKNKLFGTSPIIDPNKPSSFYKAILQNLFFATLNRDISKRKFRKHHQTKPTSSNYLATNLYRYLNYFVNPDDEDGIKKLFEQTPFLNGGLFECLDEYATETQQRDYENDNTIRKEKNAIRMDGFSDRKDNPLKVENDLFFHPDGHRGLIDILQQYQFTVEESTPLDIDVALDPELLGKVFENLLADYNPETQQAARKTTGSYYTPRTIVNYMVDESLKQHFKTHTPATEKDIETLFSDHDAPLPDSIPRKKILRAIDTIKILDPAVGSGAFPMGILQRLVNLLEKIDPKNTEYKKLQLDKAEEIEDKDSRQAAMDAIESVFSSENQYNAYGKKLYLIEHAIYGVDIQPMAIQICRLRFFISLAIEQRANNNKNDNYGIRPLPNLDTKFLIADTLIPLKDMPQQTDLFDSEIRPLRNALETNRHAYFNASTLQTKRRCREKDNQLRQQIFDTVCKNPNISPETKNSLNTFAAWDMYNPDARSEWFNPQWQLGISHFDVVIGNPPYIRHERIKPYKPQFQLTYTNTYTSTADIYVYFYELGINLLNNNGHLCYITSNKWMRAKYGTKLRTFLKTKACPQQIIDFGGKQIFNAATVDTNILLCGKSSTATHLYYGHDLPTLKKPLYRMPLDHLDSAGYVLKPPSVLAIKRKMETRGIPLKEWDVNICFGIKTGYNEAFVIDTAKRDELIAQDPKSAEIIKPILRGRDIKTYEANWAGHWIINTHNGYGDIEAIDINDYPIIKKHLDIYYPKIEKRQDKGKTPYNLRDCAYLGEFEKEKIVYSEMAGYNCFTWDTKKIYVNNTCYIMTNTNKYMLAVLNSKIIKYYMSFIAVSLGEKAVRWIKQYVERLPIPKLSAEAQQPFIALVEQVIAAKENGQDSTALEHEIDTLVYRLYGLSEEEIRLVNDGG